MVQGWGCGWEGPSCLVDHEPCKVKCDMAAKKVSEDLGRFISRIVGAEEQGLVIPGGRGCALWMSTPQCCNCSDEAGGV